MTANDPLQAEHPTPPEHEPASQPSLAKHIYHATRAGHSNLIRLLATNLPLAIPPQSSDPGALATGMLHLAPVYAAFEGQWQQHLLLPRAQGPQTDPRVLHILRRIHIPGLLRTSRIEADLRRITGWPAPTLAEQIHAVTAGDLAAFVAHIHAAVRERPPLLIAYSYLLYMGLFEGGRLIRATLDNIGEAFWAAVPTAISPTNKACVDTQSDRTRSAHGPPLRFLTFDTPDEDELRTQYDHRLAEVEGLLTPQERADIIAEAHDIFARLALLVTQIDGIVRSARSREHPAPPADEHVSASLLSWLDAAPGARPRDSLLVARERRRRGGHSHAHTHSRGPKCSRSRSTNEEEGEELQRVVPDEAPRAVKFEGGLVGPRGGQERGRKREGERERERRASAAASDLKKSQGLFDVAVAVRLAGLM